MTEKEFIQQHKDLSPSKVAILLSKKKDLDSTFILSQINGLQKAKTKLPEFYKIPNIIYPSKLSLEQCSSEETAIYKSNLIRHAELVSASILDLTGGFGIDSYYFSKKVKIVTYVEQNPNLFKVVTSNFELLNAKNINTINSSAEDFVRSTNNKFDLAYIDPSRRDENKRVFKLDECTPNIIELATDIFKISNKILIKTAPLLDIKQSLKNLKHVTNVWVISVNNDCKEVLYLLEKDRTTEPQIQTINLSNPNQEFNFNYEQESNTNVTYSEPQNYFYEPNASILKAGAFNSISNEFNLQKLAPNTHLYTSEKLVNNFPGRAFKIKKVIPYHHKELIKLGITKANVSCRNFPDSVEQIKKKLRLKDGGEDYVFAFTDLKNNPILVIGNKLDFVLKKR